MNEEDAFKWTVDFLHNAPGQGGGYGFDVYVPTLAWRYMTENEGYTKRHQRDSDLREKELFSRWLHPLKIPWDHSRPESIQCLP